MIVWITGPQGSGKTTLANEVCDRLREFPHLQLCQIDGDVIRDSMPIKLGYSDRHRQVMSSTYISFARSLSSQGLIVVVSTVSNHEWIVSELRKTPKDNLLLVWLSVPEEVRRAVRPNIYSGEFSKDMKRKFAETGNDWDLHLSAETGPDREAWTDLVVESILQKRH